MDPFASRIPTFVRALHGLRAFASFCLRLLRRVLRPLRWIALAGIVAFIAAFFLYNWIAGSHWESYRKDAAARGIALDLSRPHAAPIPDTENFTAPGSPFAPPNPASPKDSLDFAGLPMHWPNFLKGTRMTTAQAYAQEAAPSRRLRQASNPSPAPDLNGRKAAEDFLALCESRFGAQWPTILEAEARQKAQVPPVDSALPEPRYFSALMARKTFQLHAMRSMAFFDLGRDDEAFNEVQGCLNLIRGIHSVDRTSLVAYMIGTAISLGSAGPVWEGLVDRHWNESQLATLERELVEIQPMTRWTMAMDGERQWGNAVYDELAAASFAKREKDFQEILGNKSGGVTWMMAVVTCSTGFLRDNQCFANAAWDNARQLISADGQWHPEMASAPGSFAAPLSREQMIRHALAYISVPSVQRAACRVMVTEASIRQARLALALERYRRRHQDLPETLEALVPEFIDALPTDPINNAPMQYARESSESFKLRCPDKGPYGNMEIGDVVDTVKVDGKSDLIWYGLAPETNQVIKTAAR